MATLIDPGTFVAAENLALAAGAEKCRACGCLAGSLQSIERAAGDGAPVRLVEAIAAARARVAPTRYECLGCEVCWPAVALNALAEAAGDEIAGAACPTDRVTAREGWPPLPGSYRVLRYGAPVAVCTLDDDALGAAVAERASPEVGIVGGLRTENLGIERLVSNVVANPHIRFLVLAGSDARQAIGHLPGQSLVALAANGIDPRGRIIAAPGKRPLLKNIAPELVEHFRATVELLDLIGQTDPAQVLDAAADCARRDPGPAEPIDREARVPVTAGRLPERTVPDPAGYFVIYPDATRPVLSLEHYRNDGVLDQIIEGRTSAECYMAAIEAGLLSHLDHAAYLGRELPRAELARDHGEPFVQDGAPEAPPAPVCSCGGVCED